MCMYLHVYCMYCTVYITSMIICVINFIKIQILVNCRIRYNDSNLRKEPKFIVFFTQLLALFKFCHACKHESPLVEVGASWNNEVGAFGILVAGTSATKVLRVFQHMGLKCIALSTYFAHQRVGLVMMIQQ